MSYDSTIGSDFPDEGDVAYDCGGDGKRRVRTAGTAGTWYNWAGWHVIQEEDDAAGDGDLARTYVGRALAQIDGTDPATGTARYFLHDHLGSTREIRTAGKALDGQFDYTPYGTAFHASHADATTRRFTGHDYDPASGLYFAPFRYYAPGLARWTTRDPLGMVDGPNVYAYVGGNPVGGYDYFGLDRSLCFAWGHVFIRVDVYNSDGMVTSQKNLHFSPSNTWGTEKTDFTMDNAPLPTGAFSLATLPTTRREDERLLDVWEGLCTYNSGIWYTLFPFNCVSVSLVFFKWGTVDCKKSDTTFLDDQHMLPGGLIS